MTDWTDPHAVLCVARGSSAGEVRRAYRAALLASHPDKQPFLEPHATSPEPSKRVSYYSIDDINAAYRQIRDAGRNGSDEAETDFGETVINFNEIVDLADCAESELPDGSLQWSRGCRCGETSGYILFEHDLELNGDADEIAVQCSGCSIWILIQYAIE